MDDVRRGILGITGHRAIVSPGSRVFSLQQAGIRAEARRNTPLGACPTTRLLVEAEMPHRGPRAA